MKTEFERKGEKSLMDLEFGGLPKLMFARFSSCSRRIFGRSKLTQRFLLVIRIILTLERF